MEQGGNNLSFGITRRGNFCSTNELYLSLVIENLLDNANKFTDSGSVTLKIKLDKAQSKLRIEVTDTGCGIPPEEREEIFLCLSV